MNKSVNLKLGFPLGKIIENTDQLVGRNKPGRELEELKQSLIESGAVRLRPILLTAGTTLLGNVVITLDPIFNGLAWAVIFGITASTVFTLLVIPVVYHLAYSNVKGHGLPVNNGEEI